jgi:hypothetical protein
MKTGSPCYGLVENKARIKTGSYLEPKLSKISPKASETAYK